MLFLSSDRSTPERVQSAFITEDEVKNVAKFLIDNHGDEVPDAIDLGETESNDSIFSATFDEDDDKDEHYDTAVELVRNAGKASTSFLQTQLRIGYQRAARLMQSLENNGVIGPQNGAKPREILGGSGNELEEDADSMIDEHDGDYKNEYEDNAQEESDDGDTIEGR
jgi:S-DNA-T family DNA segregation ATPase FtsK/SpoIIIE